MIKTRAKYASNSMMTTITIKAALQNASIHSTTLVSLSLIRNIVPLVVNPFK